MISSSFVSWILSHKNLHIVISQTLIYLQICTQTYAHSAIATRKLYTHVKKRKKKVKGKPNQRSNLFMKIIYLEKFIVLGKY